jgi:ABC-2 type transport system permease protein
VSFSSGRALRRFGFRQTIRGALIVGAIAGLLMGVQGAAYAKAFPDEASRHKLVVSLESVSAVNFLSGEIANAGTPASYAIYKSLPLMVLITGIWGLMVSTRLLRGNEEDGRLELLAAGTTTKRRSSGQLLIGFGGSLIVACMVAFGLIAAFGTDSKVNLSVGASALMVAAVFLPGLFFAALGVFTSQLALTRGRAVLYGLAPLLVLYAVRGAANSVSNVNWLKKLTPFGWSDMLNPVLGPHPAWMLPTIVFAVLFAGLGLFWAGRRDLGAALMGQSDTARSHFYLLRSPLSFAVRRNIWLFVWWSVGTLAFAAFFAALAGLSADLANDSSAFRNIFTADSMDQFKIMFMGVGTLFIATTLLVMATMNLSAIRGEEAKGYLDNLLVRPVRRSDWLAGRLLIIVAMFTVISVLGGLVTWGVAHLNHIGVSFGLVMQGALSLLGSLALTLGIGVFFYGFWPRLAASAMAIFIGWAFVLDIFKSFFHLNSVITKTSFLYYVPSDPSKSPDWVAFAWLVALGAVLAFLGILRFTKRDIVAE